MRDGLDVGAEARALPIQLKAPLPSRSFYAFMARMSPHPFKTQQCSFEAERRPQILRLCGSLVATCFAQDDKVGRGGFDVRAEARKPSSSGR